MIELVLLVPETLVESVSDALAGELGAASVAVHDADAGGADEHALFGEPGLAPTAAGWERSSLHALFDDEDAAQGAAAWLLAQPWGAALQLLSIDPVPDEDWVRLTQSQFTPVEIERGFWIVPSWHAPPAGATQVLRLDPGLAFGTGTHPTTRMCLRWIARAAAAGRARWPRVLDYGCGSGVLAIAAALHGASEVDAVDIDPAAIAAAAANAAANGVGGRLRVGGPETAQGRYAVVLANILAAPLQQLAPVLAGHVGPGGALVLAGLLERQTDELAAAYAPWLALEVADRDEGWALMTGRRMA